MRLRRVFQIEQFNDHWLRATNVDVCDRISGRPILDDAASGPIDERYECGNILPFVTQLSQDSSTLDEEVGSPDNIPQVSILGRQSHTKITKKKLPSSTDKYNNIRAEGEHLANIASSDSHEQYNKLLTLMPYIRANLQNQSGEELKEAASTYLNITSIDSETNILPSSRMRTEGQMSTKRKKSSVESATIGSIKKG